jgi:GIY-YIG catalytic domain
MTISIYILIDPRDARVCYVGKTKKKLRLRLLSHLSDVRTGRRQGTLIGKWLGELLHAGIEPRIEEVESVVEADWEQRERYWISHYRTLGCALVNVDDGGRGGQSTIRSAATCARIAQAKLGHSVSLDTRAKLAAANRGKKQSKETVEKRVSKFRGKPGRPWSETTRAKHAARIQKPRGPLSPETRKAISRANRGKKRTLEQRHRIAVALAGKHRKGEKHPAAKLTDAKVRLIRRSVQSSKDLANKFGVSLTVVCRARNWVTWQHVL